MRIAVWANDDQWKEIITHTDVGFDRMIGFDNIPEDVAAFFLLQDDLSYSFDLTAKPIFVNAVCFTLKEINAPLNVLRVNGWQGFLSRSTWEVAGEINEPVKYVLDKLGKQLIRVPDEPGFVSARIIAMIINEAYFALEDKISTKDQIDLAIKLGTNYPYGPFEWSALIGADKILALLEKLSMNDKRYLPAALLKSEAKE